jgi:hypothetical protein
MFRLWRRWRLYRALCCGHRPMVDVWLSKGVKPKAFARTCALPRCHCVVDRRGRVRQIMGASVDEVLHVYYEVRQMEGSHRRRGPWASGSFYLAALVVVALVFLAVSRWASIWLLPIVLVAALLGLVLVGALQLRHDDRLSERSFIALMKIAITRMPILLRRSPQVEQADASTRAVVDEPEEPRGGIARPRCLSDWL